MDANNVIDCEARLLRIKNQPAQSLASYRRKVRVVFSLLAPAAHHSAFIHYN